MGLLESSGAQLRRPRCQSIGRRSSPRGPRRQPYGQNVHRRCLGQVPRQGSPRVRVCQPAYIGAPQRRPEAARAIPDSSLTVCPSRRSACPRRAGKLRTVPGTGASPAAFGASGSSAGTDSLRKLPPSGLRQDRRTPQTPFPAWCPPVVFVSYHPSPRNHQTGRLTEASFIHVLQQVRREAGLD